MASAKYVAPAFSDVFKYSCDSLAGPARALEEHVLQHQDREQGQRQQAEDGVGGDHPDRRRDDQDTVPSEYGMGASTSVAASASTPAWAMSSPVGWARYQR